MPAIFFGIRRWDMLQWGLLAPPQPPCSSTAPRPAQHRWWVAPPLAKIVSMVSLLLLFFFFPDQRSVFRCPAVHRRLIVDTPEDETIDAPSQTAAPTLVVKPS